MNGLWFLVLVLGLMAGGGCGKATAPVAEAAVTDPGEATQAQAKLPTMRLYLGSAELPAELALTPEQQRTGMMFRTNLEENVGMLFPLPYTMRASFWMKNCPRPLSAAYIDPEGIIQEIHPLEPNNTNAVLSASENIRFVLETPRGWFERHQIHQGVAVVTERGTLMQTFFGRR